MDNNNYQMFFPGGSSSSSLNRSSGEGSVFDDYRRFDQGGRASSSGSLKLVQASEPKLVMQPHDSGSGSGSGSLTGSEDMTSEKCLASTNNKKEKKVRMPRYAFQTRSQVDILDDGYRWRKYGQKAVKNNKFPRSYYRCTYEGCIVKKQVQRLTKDENVVVTTYEGMHTHPIDKPSDNFEHILSQMQIYTPF